MLKQQQQICTGQGVVSPRALGTSLGNSSWPQRQLKAHSVLSQQAVVSERLGLSLWRWVQCTPTEGPELATPHRGYAASPHTPLQLLAVHKAFVLCVAVNVPGT